MLDERIFFEQTESVNTIISIVEIFFLLMYTHSTFIKIIGNKNLNYRNKIITLWSIILISIISQFIEENLDSYLSAIVMIISSVIINAINFKKDILYTTVITLLAFGINEALYIISGIIAFIPNAIFKIKSDYIASASILIMYSLLLYRIFKIKKLKHGINFLQEKLKDSYISLLIINIGIMILFLRAFFPNTNGLQVRKIFINIVFFSVSMVFLVKQAFDLQYKQNLLTKDLEQTKAELEEKKKEISKLEKENLKFSKSSHSLAHKQKSLEYKLEKLMKTSVDEKSKEAIKQEIQNISKEVYKEPQQIELPKTEIEAIDDMFSYMQSECIKDNIKFELQIVGNPFYMINHLISESELEILLADHIKDAIIAINYSDNTNRSILVRIGKIDNVYSLYIYDSGIEFEKEVLENLGKKPITTHADSGGTGMGFMNTFDTLNRTKASLIINEIGKPCIDNYTKVLIFKFDNKNEFIVNSYKSEVAVV